MEGGGEKRLDFYSIGSKELPCKKRLPVRQNNRIESTLNVCITYKYSGTRIYKNKPETSDSYSVSWLTREGTKYSSSQKYLIVYRNFLSIYYVCYILENTSKFHYNQNETTLS